MSLSRKVLIIMSMALVVALAIFFIYREVEHARAVSEIQRSLVEQKELMGNISRAQSSYASRKDIEDFARKQNIDLNAIQKDMNTLNANMVGINGITVVSQSQHRVDVPSTDVTPRPDGVVVPASQDPFGYLSNRQVLTLNEKFANTLVPFGSVGFSSWQGKPWDFTVFERKYSITSVLGIDSQNKHYMYNKFSIYSDGKRYDVKIDDNKFLEEYPKSTFKWFSPQLFIGTDATLNVSEIPIKLHGTIDLNLGIMSYGQYNKYPDLSIIQVGAGYDLTDSRPKFLLSPIQYNIGRHIPIMNNLYIGPSVQFGINGDIGIGAGIRAGL